MKVVTMFNMLRMHCEKVGQDYDEIDKSMIVSLGAPLQHMRFMTSARENAPLTFHKFGLSNMRASQGDAPNGTE